MCYARLIGVALMSLTITQARAQDVPGIEICTAEKTMERRTGCLQSNVNFLMRALTKLATDNETKLAAANRQIDALKLQVTTLQKTLEDQKAERDKAKTDAKPGDAKPVDTKPGVSPAK
jgi:hypothetical protein